MDDWLDTLETEARLYLPEIVAALVILLVGWLIAVVVSAIVRGILKRTSLDERLARQMGAGRETQLSVGEWIAKAVFWLIIVFALAAAFRTLDVRAVSEPLDRMLAQLFAFLPRILGAAVLLLIAWIVARVVRALVVRVLEAANLDERLGTQLRAPPQPARPATAADARSGAPPPPVQRPGTPPSAPPPAGAARGNPPLSRTLGDVAYWLVFLLFLPAILSALQLPGVLEPVQRLLNEVLAFLPNLVGAGLILLVGWFVATIIRRIVTGLLSAAGVDRLAERVGIQQAMGTQTLSGLLGLLVYVLIFIPVVIAALNALDLESLSAPASTMLAAVLAAIPRIFAAAVILAIAYFVGRLLATLVAGLLAGFGFDTVLERLGVTRQPGPNERTPSEIAGYAVLVATMLFAAIQAAEVLQFAVLAQIIRDFTVFTGHVLLGLIILAIGIYLANLVDRLVRRSDVEQAGLLATAARVAILVLAVAMALREAGLAEDIVNLAFLLLLGAVAVAVAIAFGMGGREIAGRELQRWIEQRRAGQLVTPGETGGPTIPPTTTRPATTPRTGPPPIPPTEPGPAPAPGGGP